MSSVTCLGLDHPAVTCPTLVSAITSLQIFNQVSRQCCGTASSLHGFMHPCGLHADIMQKVVMTYLIVIVGSVAVILSDQQGALPPHSFDKCILKGRPLPAPVVRRKRKMICFLFLFKTLSD